MSLLECRSQSLAFEIVNFTCARRRFPIPPRRANNISKPQDSGPRRNEDIRVSPVRVVDAEGEMLGEMEVAKALELAEEAGMDLVMVGEGAKPPVCRIMDYSKVQYEKKKKSTGPKQHRTQLKQIRLRAKIGDHDVQVKVDAARKFLARRDKVKVNVMFRGRENAHHDLGRDLLEKFIEQLADISSVEQPPRMESGRMMSATLSPLAK